MPKKPVLKGKITIIIPVHYERHNYLERLLDYYSHVNVDILICDSSNEVFQNARKYKNAEYHYYKGVSYAKKLNDIMKKVKTKYAVMCGVDDFIVPDALVTCVDFLEKNKDYSSVQGHIISFYKKNKKVIYGPSFMEVIGKDVNSGNVFDRMKKQLKPYSEIIYCVTLTQTLRNRYSDESSTKIKDYNLWELYTTLISVIDGKHKILPIFYEARESMADSDANFVSPLNIFIKSDKNQDEYKDFLNLIAKHISEKEKIPFETAKKKLVSIINHFIGLEHKHNTRARMALLKLIYSISPKIGLFIKNIYFEIKRVLNIRKTKNIPGYPFYDGKAKKQLDLIDSHIKKHNIRSKWRTIQV